MTITMGDIKQASINRRNMTKATYVNVTMGLEIYLLDVMARLLEAKNKTDLFATMHTFFEIGIQAGIDAERKRHAAETLAMMQAIADAPVVE